MSQYDAKHLAIAYLNPFDICGSCDTCDICSYKRSLLQEKLSFVEEVVLVTAVDSHGTTKSKAWTAPTYSRAAAAATCGKSSCSFVFSALQ